MNIDNIEHRTMEDEDDKIVELLLFVLKFYGIYPFKENISAFQRNWLLAYSYTAYIGMVVSNICLLRFSQDIVTSISALSVIIGTTYFFLVQFFSAYKRENLRRLLVALGSHDVEWSVFVKTFVKIEKKIPHSRMFCIHSWIAAYNIASFTMVMAFPICSVWFLEIAEMGDPSSLVFPCWYPWNMKETRWYFFSYIIQIASAVLFQMVSYTTTAFNWIVLCIFKNDFHELQLVIRSLRRAQSTQNFINDLECCIKRHQTLLR